MLLKGEVEIKGDQPETGLETLKTLFKMPGIKIGQEFPNI